jgi:hypothetical protein
MEEEAAKHSVAMHRETAAEAAQQDAVATQTETAAEVKALNARLSALDSFAKDYEKKKRRNRVFLPSLSLCLLVQFNENVSRIGLPQLHQLGTSQIADRGAIC